MEKRVFDLIARRFIAVFYPDCKFSTTTVLGEVDKVEFKATGKQILEPGWRVIFAKEQQEETKENEEERILPLFTIGESGPHTPDLTENGPSLPSLIPKPLCSVPWKRLVSWLTMTNCVMP